MTTGGLTIATTGHACPACRGPVEGESCMRCGRHYPPVAGLPDFRLESDRYLGIDDERAKAERLAAIAETTNLEGVARAYYAITPDVDPPRCARYLAHILGAEARGEALADCLPDGGPILEVGCGTGGLLVAAARRGLAIQGVDIASRWLVVARRRLDDRGLRVPLAAASAERLPWPDGTFAAVVADSVLEHCDDPLAALREWRRVLRPGGRLILWSPNRFAPVVDPHVRLWGVGFLPRSWASAYSRLRRGGAWVPRTLSVVGASRLARAAGFDAVDVGPAPISRPWALSRPPRQRRAIRVYESMRSFAPTRALLAAFGPIWALEASKPVERRPFRADGSLEQVSPDRTIPAPDALPRGRGGRSVIEPIARPSRTSTDPARSGPRLGLAACLGAEAIAGFLGFGATVHQARSLGPAGFATVEVALAVSAWFLVLVRGGLDAIVVREAARRPRLIGRLTVLLIALRLVWAAIGVALLAAVAGLGGGGLVVASGLVLLTSALVADVGPRARREFGWLASGQILRAGGMAAFVVLMVRGPGDLGRAAIAPGVAEGLVALLYAVRSARGAGWQRARWSARAAAVLSRRAAVAGLTRFVRVGLYACDAMALGLTTGRAAEGGPYAASRRIAFAGVAVGVVVPTLLAPSIARAWGRGAATASAEIGRGAGLLLGLFVPAALGLALTSGRVLPALFGPGYGGGTWGPALVAARLPMLLVATWLGSALVSLGREREALRTTGLAGVAALVAVPFGAITGGPVGLGAAALGAEVLAAVGAWRALRGLGIEPFRGVAWGRLAGGSAGLVAAVLVAWPAPTAGTCLAGAVGYAMGSGLLHRMAADRGPIGATT